MHKQQHNKKLEKKFKVENFLYPIKIHNQATLGIVLYIFKKLIFNVNCAQQDTTYRANPIQFDLKQQICC